MPCNHPSPGLCKVFELGVDRANEVELLFAPPAFELFFPCDGCANVFLAFKVEQAFATISRSETFQYALLMLHDAQIQVAGDPNVNRACMAGRECRCSCRTWHDASSFCSRLQGKTVGSCSRASVVGKLRTVWVR